MLKPPQPTTAAASTAETVKGEAENLYASLLLLGLGKKANDLLECGNAYYAVQCYDCLEESRVTLSCHLRLCPRCADRLARTFIARHWTALSKMTQPKLLTLTFLSTARLTRATITKCIKDLSKLRHRKLWKKAVRGGLAGLELTWGPPGWHPHFHCLIDSDYIPRPALIAAWTSITGGAWHVDIRQIQSQDGVHEVAKYIGKGWTFYRQKHLLAQYLEATHKRRFFNAFGSLFRATDPLTNPTIPTPDPLTSGPTAQELFGRSFIRACFHCGSYHLTNLGKRYDTPVQRPTVQIPF